MIQTLSQWTHTTPSLVVAFALIASVLLIGSVIRWIAVWRSEPALRRARLGSLVVWWLGLALLAAIAIGGLTVAVLAFVVVSWIGLRECFALLDRAGSHSVGRLLVLLAMPISYWLILCGREEWFAIVVPIGLPIALSIRFVAAGVTRGYRDSLGGLLWSALLLLYFLPHAVRLLALPGASNPQGGVAGWLVYLVVLTESDDIFQALWGRQFGRHRIAPTVSPNKSWEGLLGGFATTIVIGVVLAPFLTPLSEPWSLPMWPEVRVPHLGSILASLIISISGFFGDLNMAALKRDVGVKDTGDWLPTQGGILDRINSLLFTAPVFYYFVRMVVLPRP